jgi:hypothetical protein
MVGEYVDKHAPPKTHINHYIPISNVKLIMTVDYVEINQTRIFRGKEMPPAG